MRINYDNNPYGDIELGDGRYVRLTEEHYNDNDCHGNAAWFARGYLDAEDTDYESGPTVTACWASLGNDEPENDADWDNPDSITHYSLGELEAEA
jgi:hypothetical protein